MFDGIGRNSEVNRNIRHHRRRMQGKLWLLGDDRRVNVYRPPALFGQQGDGGAQQDAAVNVPVARIAVGKVAADVAQRDGAEQGIGDRMEQRIGIGVSEQAGCVGDFDAAEDELAPGDQSMNVVALPDPEIHLRPLNIIAARRRSA